MQNRDGQQLGGKAQGELGSKVAARPRPGRTGQTGNARTAIMTGRFCRAGAATECWSMSRAPARKPAAASYPNCSATGSTPMADETEYRPPTWAFVPQANDCQTGTPVSRQDTGRAGVQG
eukprot:SAG22_NODE_1209_length_5162_cov_16.551649_2_plen_120_part_00